jgi:hypothetical protein
MLSDLEFLLGLLDHDFPAHAAQEDFEGEHAVALRLWQHKGFLATEPGQHPVPSCPHCHEGIPYPLGGRYLCNFCCSTVDPRHLFLWRFDLESFLTWVARSLGLQGGMRPVDDTLWQLGSLADPDYRYECFFLRHGILSERGRQRLLAYRQALLLQPLPGPPLAGFPGPSFSLLELLCQDRHRLTITDPLRLLHRGGTVHFEESSGELLAGEHLLGEVPVGSKEYHFLACLAQQQNMFVPYADLKSCVLRRSGSTDATDEATFCHKLKGRIKARWIPKFDLVMASTNKGDGYRLRGRIER